MQSLPPAIRNKRCSQMSTLRQTRSQIPNPLSESANGRVRIWLRNRPLSETHRASSPVRAATAAAASACAPTAAQLCLSFPPAVPSVLLCRLCPPPSALPLCLCSFPLLALVSPPALTVCPYHPPSCSTLRHHQHTVALRHLDGSPGRPMQKLLQPTSPPGLKVRLHQLIQNALGWYVEFEFRVRARPARRCDSAAVSARLAASTYAVHV